MDTGWDMSEVVRGPNLDAKDLTTFSNLEEGSGTKGPACPLSVLPTNRYFLGGSLRMT